MLKTACASIALLALSNPALAASCASPVDAAALKTAVLQQELMVAALQCHETGAYNRFVMTYRPELQSSDATLKAFFVRRGGEHGEAGYDAFKTKAANLSALEQARDTPAFCADAHALFRAALSNQGSLMSFVDARSADIGNICVESRPALPALARAEIKPEKAPALIRVAEARPAEVAVGGVPAHSLPAIPYRHEDSPPPPTSRAVDREEDRDAAQDDQEDARPSYANEDNAPLPPRPHYYQIRSRPDRDYEGRDYQEQAYYPPPRDAYGPPPGWREYPAPRYGWYPRDDYYGR
ncbi:MAG TPA: hypothetical protein VNY75_11235 [Rhizomicrobium sp.]|nr:hypothetical protein [Rhizomicrobium sp.]